jgi:hypothetical protein
MIDLLVRLFWVLLSLRRSTVSGFDIAAPKYFWDFRYGMTTVVRSREKDIQQQSFWRSGALHAWCITAKGGKARRHAGAARPRIRILAAKSFSLKMTLEILIGIPISSRSV